MVAASGLQVGADIETFFALDQRTTTITVSSSSSGNVVLQYPVLQTDARPTVRLYNAGPGTCYIRFGTDPAMEAVVPNGATDTLGDVAFPSGAIEVFPVPLADDGTTVIAAVSTGGSAVLFVSPGYGA